MPSQSTLFQIALVVNIFGIFFVLGYLGLKTRRWKMNHSLPDHIDIEIVHQERKASGRSLSNKNWVTRIGGANRTLIVIVTPTDLWITVPVLLGWAADKCDLDHRIPLESIASIEQTKKILTIHWSINDQAQQAFELHLREPDAFLKAVGHAAKT